MGKYYARVYPAYTPRGDGCADIIWPLVVAIDYFLHERMCGYSLYGKIDFFDSLETATHFKFDPNNLDWYHPSYGVVEFETGNEKLTLLRIHEFYRFDKTRTLTDGHSYFQAAKVEPVWRSRSITQQDLSKGAFAEFKKQFSGHLQEALPRVSI